MSKLCDEVKKIGEEIVAGVEDVVKVVENAVGGLFHKTTEIGALTSTDVAALSSTQITTLTTDQVSALTLTQTSTLTTDAVPALTATQVVGLTD